MDDLKAAFFDDFATPFAVCRPPRPAATGDNLSATVMMIVMKPAELDGDLPAAGIEPHVHQVQPAAVADGRSPGGGIVVAERRRVARW